MAENEVKSNVVQSRVREIAGSFNVSGEFLEHLSGEVARLVERAMARSAANGRVTLQAKDL